MHDLSHSLRHDYSWISENIVLRFKKQFQNYVQTNLQTDNKKVCP